MYVGDVAVRQGTRWQDTWQGDSAVQRQVATQADDAAGDVGLTSQGEGGKWFLGAPPLDKGGFGGGGSATAREVTRGGSTAAIPPISRTLTFGRLGDGKARPP